MKKFNINDHMYIQITESGWNHIKNTESEEYINNCIKDREIIINDETWYRLQLHNVFELFPINNSNNLLFNTDVMFDDKDLS